ncbi:hypothetical protein I6E29_00815 [Arcanobacterium haemolyticum]|nr:hypothetical protein [Arcanobacterium haemolyticum]
MSTTKFVLNRGAFSDQILKNTEIQARSKTALRQAIGSDDSIKIRDQSEGRYRNGVVAIGKASRKGKLQEALARVQVS